MARVQVSQKVYESLAREYSIKFDGSSSKLSKAIEKANEIGIITGSHVVAEKTIRNFFEGGQAQAPQNKVLESTLNGLCKFLLTYDSYSDALNAIDPQVTEVTLVNNLEKPAQTLTQEWLQEYDEVIQEDCQMRILDMNEPRAVKDIFVEVRFLGTPKRQQQRTIDEIMQLMGVDISADRPNTELTTTSDELKISGFQAVKKYGRLMVLGRPGAGKTTFLKQVATVTMSELLATEDLAQNPLPIYIRLKNFSETRDQETLMDAIQEKVKGIDIESLLEQGQCLILLDALDEVVRKEVERVYADIERLINKYPKNRFVVTCRNAAREYLLNNFTLVEIAEFNGEQIDQFVKQWFQTEPKTGELFLASIRDSSNNAMLELAGTPLMLTILCLTFDAKYGLASNRYALYRDMIDVLSRRWDASRRILREMFYADGLTQERLLDMLAEIAYNGFTKDQPQYFWKRWDLEEEIAIFTQRIFAFETENKSIASTKVLNAIEANTGIFVEEVRDTYKFAHLTFQEYFTARHISLSGDKKLLKIVIDRYLIDPQWKEVFRVIPGRLRNADEFFLDIFWKINKIGRNSQIKALLERLDIATRKHGVSSCGWRSLYLAVMRNTYYVAEHGVVVNFPWARRLAAAIRELNTNRKQLTAPTPSSLVTTYLLILHYSVYQRVNEHTPQLKENIISDSIEVETTTFFDKNSQECLQEAIEQSQLINIDLAENLIYLKNSFPEFDAGRSYQEKWLERLLQIISEFLDIGRFFHLNEEDIKELNNYLYACNILVDCIGGDSVASPKLRNQIIDNLLLPLDRIPSELLEA